VSKPRERLSQVERRAESERRLLTATASLIIERGLNNASLVEIGRRAGYSHALINHLFGSKARMIDRLNDVAFDLYREETELALRGKEGIDLVLAFAETYLRLVTGDDPIGRVQVVLWVEAVSDASEIRPSRVLWDQRFREGVAALVVRACSCSGPEIDGEAIAFVIVGLLRGVALQLLIDSSAMTVGAAIGGVDDVLRGLLAPLVG
jgi:AcrR family transcriptional regulator